MRVVIVQRLTMAHGIRGGMETVAQAVATGLLARGHELLVLTAPHPAGAAIGEEQGVPVRYVGPGSPRRYQRRWWAACYAELARLQRSSPFDVLLSHGAGALEFLPQLPALELPAVVLLHGTPASERRTRLRDRHGPRGWYRLLRYAAALPEWRRRWRSAGRADAWWLALTPHMAAEARHDIGMPAGRIRVVPNGIATDRFRPDPRARAATRLRYDLAEGAPLLVASGRLEREKGFATAIAALARLRGRWPGAQLLIAGAGPEQGALERVARRAGGVRLLGHVPHDALPELLAAADLYLLPTERDEGMPLALLEALACGVPALASRVPGTAELLRPGVGLLLPAGDAAAWATACAALLADDRRRRAIGELARQYVVARYSLAAMVDAVEQALAAAQAPGRRLPRVV